MIRFEDSEGIFNFRVAGILINNNRILIHRGLNDAFYAFPGGRVEMFEDTETTLIREFKEEIDIDIEIERLLWVNENFFTLHDKKYHELCFYYLVNCKAIVDIFNSDVFYSTELSQAGTPHLEFRWVDISRISEVILYPVFAKDRLNDLPSIIERVVEYE